MIIEGAEPFFLRGNETGILLIHGFTGSPAELLPLGKFLNQAGFTVLCIRLAGHGTDENNLSRTTCDDWFNSVLDGYSLLRSSCEKIFVIGHSMGSLLSLKLAAVKNLDKLVTLSPPFFINDGFHLEKLPPRSDCEGLFVVKPRRKLKNVPPAVNKTYRRFPLVCVHEFLKLRDEVQKLLPQIQTPLLIMHAKDDHTAEVKSAKFLYQSVASTQVRLITVSNGGHLIPLNEGREFIFEKVLEFCN